MIRSIGLSVALLSIALLMSSVSAFARTGGAFGPNPGSTAQMKALASAVNPSQFPTIWASAIYTGGGDGNHDDDDDKDKDKDKDKDHHHDHDPTPEPSTILSFGAALLIGGGVLYSRRLRKGKK
jgi:hypothetical protein